MLDARHYRIRAQHCLDLAEQISDRKARAQLRAQAAALRFQAMKLEAGKRFNREADDRNARE